MTGFPSTGFVTFPSTKPQGSYLFFATVNDVTVFSIPLVESIGRNVVSANTVPVTDKTKTKEIITITAFSNIKENLLKTNIKMTY